MLGGKQAESAAPMLEHAHYEMELDLKPYVIVTADPAHQTVRNLGRGPALRLSLPLP